MKHVLIAVILNSALLAAGILIVLITCIEWDNYYPLFTVLCDVAAITQLMLCGTCHAAHDYGDEYQFPAQFSWMVFGLLLIFGYAIPSLLWRAGSIPDVALYWTLGGSTVIVSAMMVYMKLINRAGDKYE